MNFKTFILKVLRFICIILLLSTLLVLAIKNRHSSALIECQNYFIRGDIHLQQLNVPLFLFYANFLAKYILTQTETLIKFLFYIFYK